MTSNSYASYHEEVVSALKQIGSPKFGDGILGFRDSQLLHFGVAFPALRQRVKQGFSFGALPEGEVLQIWDDLWTSSQYGEVLFAALEYYMPIVRKRVSPDLWPVVRHWTDRVDNWCHSDMLSNLYSRILERYTDDVYPELEKWNQSDGQWLRRISIVSLIHYSGKNAVFLPPVRVLPLVTNCLDDHRHYVELAVGWVLREMGHVYPDDIAEYLKAHAGSMSSPAFARAIERRSAAERAELLAVRSRAQADQAVGRSKQAVRLDRAEPPGASPSPGR
jgi:3-methyladenine DNA glycosylase AlkD